MLPVRAHRQVVPRAKLGFVTTPSTAAPFSNVGDVTAASMETRLEEVGLETGSSYSDVGVTGRHAVSNAKLGFVTTPSVSARVPTSGTSP